METRSLGSSEPDLTTLATHPTPPKPQLTRDRHVTTVEQDSDPARITFDCLAQCSCVWRALLDRRAIFPLASAVPSSTPILHALKVWMSNVKEMAWDDWVEEDLAILMSLLENVSGRRETSPIDSRLCQSWIRKVARQTGTLPTSFILQGVKKESENAVAGGGFADVYVGTYADQKVALKVLRVFVKENRRRIIKDLMHETLFWRYLDHQHLLPLLGVSEDAVAPRLSLVTPWMVNGNILEYLEEHDDADQLPLIIQCSHGVCYLHEYTPGLIHGDIRCANILIDEERKVRITDFGLLSITESQAYGTSHTVLTDRGSVRWMAPELFGSQIRKTRFTDVYAFGMTILEIYTRSPPFKSLGNDMQIIMAVTQGRRPDRPNEPTHLEDELWSLVTQCWEADPKVRPHIRRATEKLERLMEERARANSSKENFNILVPSDVAGFANPVPTTSKRENWARKQWKKATDWRKKLTEQEIWDQENGKSDNEMQKPSSRGSKPPSQDPGGDAISAEILSERLRRKLSLFSRSNPKMACDFCRKRKIKCDGMQPQCGTYLCMSQTADCTWDESPRRRGPGLKTAIRRVTSRKDKSPDQEMGGEGQSEEAPTSNYDFTSSHDYHSTIPRRTSCSSRASSMHTRDDNSPFSGADAAIMAAAFRAVLRKPDSANRPSEHGESLDGEVDSKEERIRSLRQQSNEEGRDIRSVSSSRRSWGSAGRRITGAENQEHLQFQA